MADNTRQARWMVVIFGNLSALHANRSDVFVAMNLFWYPVEGHPELRIAPDVLVVFGRPKGDRGSYRQWEEGNIPLTVVFEILSPGNTFTEMDDKLVFYEEYGVEEYYVYDPDQNRLKVFVRQGDVLRRVRPVEDFVSPRLGIRFDLSGSEMVVYRPDSWRFLTFEELEADRNRAWQQAEQARRQAARLVELSRKARRGGATAEELQELERLEEELGPRSAG
jgi:Uma2 family endonuclease